MERLETQTCNGDSTSFEKEMLALLDEQIFLQIACSPVCRWALKFTMHQVYSVA